MKQRPHDPDLSAEHLVHAAASRHGLRTHDYTLSWDQGTFDPDRAVHELAITTRDGRRATVQIEAGALGQQNAWLYFPHVERALSTLSRRFSDRGADAGVE